MQLGSTRQCCYFCTNLCMALRNYKLTFFRFIKHSCIKLLFFMLEIILYPLVWYLSCLKQPNEMIPRAIKQAVMFSCNIWTIWLFHLFFITVLLMRCFVPHGRLLFLIRLDFSRLISVVRKVTLTVEFI